MKNLLNLISKNRELHTEVTRLRKENLKMRLEMEVLFDFPYSKAADVIKSKYRNPKKTDSPHDSKRGN